MKKKLLLLGIIIFGGVLFFNRFFQESEIEKIRKKHMSFLKNHPYQKTMLLPRKARRAIGRPPNAYFEQKHLSEINPYTGKTNKEALLKLQESLNAQKHAQKVPGGISTPWIERGPDNVGGRTRAVIFDPNDTTNETVFAGGVSGGLWKNTNISNESSKWERVGVPENLAVSCIAVDPNNSQTFYVGTGESYVSGDVNGNGLWKSTDGGKSWAKVFGGVTGASFLDTNSKLTVNSPSNIAKDYISILATAFGGNLNTDVSGNLVLVSDGTSPFEDACEDISNVSEINGKIAVIKRGGCNFDEKILRAQNAGAKAVIMVNNVNGNPIAMGGDDTTVTIPAIMITKEDGDKIINFMSNNTVNVTLKKGNDNSLNSTIVPGIQHINDIVIRNNAGTSEVYIAAGESRYPGSVSLGGESYGLYKSTDGTNFSKIFIPKTSGGKEYEPNNLEIAPDNSIYMSTNQSAIFGDGGGAIFKSTNGTDFKLIHTVANGRRTEIALSPNNNRTVYVLAQMADSNNPVKLLKTTDDFANTKDLPLPNDADTNISANDFTRGQAGYDLLLKIDPNNENILYVGGIDLFKSIDGGESWNQISHWFGGFDFQYVHADQHGLAFASSSKMVFSNDGGVYFSNNSGTNILARNNNYNTVQFYSVGVAPTTAFNGQEYFLAGAQDNGTLLILNASNGINSSVEVQGGDGAESMFDTDGSDKYHISNYIYNQSIVLRNHNSGQTTTINNEDASNGDFINQEELDSQLNILYANYSSGTNYIIKRYSGLLGTIVKEDLTNSLMNAEPSKFKVSPFTKKSTKLLVGLKNGKLLKVENANSGDGSWSEISSDEFIGSISDIEFGKNENEIFVTMHNYGVKNIWYTNDGGSTWKNKEGDLPDIPVKSILQNPLNLKEVIIGTDLGVWKTTNVDQESPNWTRSDNGMSNVPVLDLDLRNDNTVFAATYGRGIFSAKFTLAPNEDLDSDGILNRNDNCPNTPNPDQADADNNGIGDVCQDTDNDGIIDTKDNCPNVTNPDQIDANNNGVGDVCEDTDGDGIIDVSDNCPNNANPNQEDINNNGVGDICDTSFASPNNISVETISETCTNQNDGKIKVNVKETFVSYTVKITGQSKNITEQLTTQTKTFSNFEPGIYEVCVEVNDRDYKQCFEVNISAALPVALKMAKNQQSKGYTVNISSGTAPYKVFLNGELVETYNTTNFEIATKKSGILEVKTAKNCEGVYKTAIDNIFLKQNPVDDVIQFKLPINSPLNIDVTIFDIKGNLVLKQTIARQGYDLFIPLNSYKSGIYIVNLGIKKSKAIKIIKR